MWTGTRCSAMMAVRTPQGSLHMPTATALHTGDTTAVSLWDTGDPPRNLESPPHVPRRRGSGGCEFPPTPAMEASPTPAEKVRYRWKGEQATWCVGLSVTRPIAWKSRPGAGCGSAFESGVRRTSRLKVHGTCMSGPTNIDTGHSDGHQSCSRCPVSRPWPCPGAGVR